MKSRLTFEAQRIERPENNMEAISFYGRWKHGDVEWGVTKTISHTINPFGVKDELHLTVIGFQAVVDEYLDWLEST